MKPGASFKRASPANRAHVNSPLVRFGIGKVILAELSETYKAGKRGGGVRGQHAVKSFLSSQLGKVRPTDTMMHYLSPCIHKNLDQLT